MITPFELPIAADGYITFSLRAIGPGEAAEDVVVRFPETRRFEREFDAMKVGRTASDRRLLGGRKVAGNPRENRERDRADAIVGLGHLLAGSMLDPNPMIAAPDRQRPASATALSASPGLNGVGNPIHAADRLEHGGLHVPDMLEQVREGHRG